MAALSQRQYFNERVGDFDVPQPRPVIERLTEVVGAAGLRPGEVVLDIGTGVGVLIPLIQSFKPSRIIACDIAEKMLQRLQQKHPQVQAFHLDVADLALEDASVDVAFLNAMFGNIADKPRACRNLSPHAAAGRPHGGEPSRRPDIRGGASAAPAPSPSNRFPSEPSSNRCSSLWVWRWLPTGTSPSST